MSCNGMTDQDFESNDVERFVDAREFSWLPATMSQEYDPKISTADPKARDTVHLASPWFWPFVISVQSWLQFLHNSAVYSFDLAGSLLPELCQTVRALRAPSLRRISRFLNFFKRPLHDVEIDTDTILRLTNENEGLWANNLMLEDQLTDSEAQRHSSNLNVLSHIHTIMCQDKEIEKLKSGSAKLKNELSDHKETLAVWKDGQSEERSGLRAKLRAVEEEKQAAGEESLRSKRATEAFVRMLSLSKKSREDLDAKVQDLESENSLLKASGKEFEDHLDGLTKENSTLEAALSEGNKSWIDLVEEQRKVIDRSQQMLQYRYKEVRLLRRAFSTMAETYNDTAKTSNYQLMLALVLNKRVCELENLLDRNKIRYNSVGRVTMMSTSMDLLGAGPDGSFKDKDGAYTARRPLNSVELCPNMPEEYDEDEYWRDLCEDEKAKAQGQGDPSDKREEQKQEDNEKEKEEETGADGKEKEKEHHSRGGFSVSEEEDDDEEDDDDQWESENDDGQSRIDSEDEDEDSGDEDEDDRQGQPKSEVIDGLPRLPQASEMEDVDLGEFEQKGTVDQSENGQDVLTMLANAVAKHKTASSTDSQTFTNPDAEIPASSEAPVEQLPTSEHKEQPSLSESTPKSESTSTTPPSKSTEGTSEQSSSADKSSFTADFCDTAIPIHFQAGPRKVEDPVKQSAEGDSEIPAVAASSLSSYEQLDSSVVAIPDSSRQDKTTSSLQQEQQNTSKAEAAKAAALATAADDIADAADIQNCNDGRKMPRKKILAGMTKTQQRRQRQKWAREKKELEEAENPINP